MKVEIRVTGQTIEEVRRAARHRRHVGGVTIKCEGPELFSFTTICGSHAEAAEFFQEMQP